MSDKPCTNYRHCRACHLLLFIPRWYRDPGDKMCTYCIDGKFRIDPAHFVRHDDAPILVRSHGVDRAQGDGHDVGRIDTREKS